MAHAPIRIVAAVVYDARGHVLLVRKRGTSKFMLPGGKREADEAACATLSREIAEELICEVGDSTLLGRFSAPAANEPDRIVEAELYRVTLTQEPVVSAEIDALCWLDPADPGDVELAPLVRAYVLPLATGWSAR